VTSRAAECRGLADYGLAEGWRADRVVFDAPTPVDAVRTLAVRTAVISRGGIVADHGHRGRSGVARDVPADPMTSDAARFLTTSTPRARTSRQLKFTISGPIGANVK
jgi:cytosine/adenosine deaminase-related metal-dependent hydrolase